MMKAIFANGTAAISLLFLFALNLFAQPGNGKLVITGEPGVEKLLDAYKQINEARKTIPGYRVQIHFGGEREKAKEVKTKFLSLYNQVQAYESYQSPNFRVRVGDFRSRLEAISFQKKINASFPSSYVVQDMVSLPELEPASR